MGSSGHNFKRWFRGADGSQAKAAESAKTAPRTSRRCIGLGEFMRSLKSAGEAKLSVLDLGPTTPANIAFITELGARVYNQDILHDSQDPDYLVKQEDGSMQIDPAKFFSENLNYPAGHFDAILCWDVADYLPEPLVKPLVERLQTMLKAKGNLLAFFHTKDAGAESRYSRHHIVQQDMLELEPIEGFRLQRIFNNRHIENLFKDFASRKFFLGRDNIREVLLVR
ncbi:MAG TPA: methyltransferase domain-containing protein [Candidatus Angelobacter sp.]|nr:methyltransferase domain-containing protein [Candidatus Angelobacter sp.]